MSSDTPLLSVIIPCFEEVETLPEMVSALTSAFPAAYPVSAEFIFVNDGSTDDTAHVLAAMSARDARIVAVNLPDNVGQTWALWEGLAVARGPWIAHLDGDLQNDPSDLPEMLRLAMAEDWDAVLGFRAERHDHWQRRVASRFANAVRQAILHDSIRDVGCSTRVVKRNVLNQLRPIPNQHRYLPALLQRGNWCVTQVATTHHDRRHGHSKYDNWHRGWEGLRDMPRMAGYIRQLRTQSHRRSTPCPR